MYMYMYFPPDDLFINTPCSQLLSCHYITASYCLMVGLFLLHLNSPTRCQTVSNLRETNGYFSCCMFSCVIRFTLVFIASHLHVHVYVYVHVGCLL